MSSETAGSAGTIDRARELIESRLDQLERERDQLREALTHLGGGAPRARRTRAAGPTASGRAGRGQRQAEFLEKVQANPGASVPDLAREMGVQPQQLYAIVRRLTAGGTLAKRDGTYVVLERTPEG